jgi:flagellar assembly factor FliW
MQDNERGDVRGLVRDAVAVCQTLTRLLDGAIGCCRKATGVKSGSSGYISPIHRIVETVVARVSRVADVVGVLVSDEGPRDLFVSIDPEVVNRALETLVLQAVSRPLCTGGVVRLSYTRCGAHVVVGVTTQNHELTSEQLRRLHVASHFRTNGEWDDKSEFAEVYSSLSLMLLEQGGYIDVELEADEGLTVFLVMPAVDSDGSESANDGIALADDDSTERGGPPALGQKRSDIMIVNSDRFGAIEVDTKDALAFPTGIIGFPNENEFVLIRKADSQMVAWLQSTHTPYLTLPVVSAHVLASRYPDVAIEEFAERAGLGSNRDDLAVLAVLSAPPGMPATVNLMAPIIVNAVTRAGAQVLLEGTRFSTRELFILPAPPTSDEERATQTTDTQPEHSSTSAA